MATSWVMYFEKRYAYPKFLMVDDYDGNAVPEVVYAVVPKQDAPTGYYTIEGPRGGMDAGMLGLREALDYVEKRRAEDEERNRGKRP